MFPVRYVSPSIFELRPAMMFCWDGAVHLLETGLVLEGNLPRLRPPFLLGVYHRFLCGHSVISVPYSMIDEHRRSFLSRRHHVLFALPAGGLFGLSVPDGQPRKKVVAFKLKERGRSDEFASLVAGCMSTAKSFALPRETHVR